MVDNVEIDHLNVNKIFMGVFENIAETMLNTKLEYAPPEVELSSVMPGEITSIMNISGFLKDKPFKGVYAISWSEKVYLAMASEMLMEEYTELCEDNVDAGCELVNIIYGNCKPLLVENNYKVDMSIPMLARAQNFEILSLQLRPSMITTIDSAIGQFHVILSMTMLKDEEEAGF